MKAFDPNYKLLDEMYQDNYYPAFLVDKVKDELQKVIHLLENGETDTEVIQETLDEAVCGINDLQDEFYENDSEIETVARECIAAAVVCDECGSLFFKGSSQMMGLCPECAHVLYGYPNCSHHFQNGRCVNCYWDGSKSVYIKKQNQQEETDMPTTEWLNKYEAIKDRLTCKDDLEAHFTEKVIGNMAVDVLDIGSVHFPTGTIFTCDPLVELEDTPPFIQTIPAGTYPVKICVVPSEKYGDRYACVKVEISREKPVRYELGMTGNEELDAALGDDDYFGFGVDAGMGCIADIQTQAAFKTYWAKRLEEDPDIDPYNDLFCDLLEENAQAHPKYQGDCGDWLNWTVPDTDCNLPIFASGWGDGYYPVYFGYDAKGEVCAVYVRFIDIEASYKEQA